MRFFCRDDRPRRTTIAFQWSRGNDDPRRQDPAVYDRVFDGFPLDARGRVQMSGFAARILGTGANAPGGTHGATSLPFPAQDSSPQRRYLEVAPSCAWRRAPGGGGAALARDRTIDRSIDRSSRQM